MAMALGPALISRHRGLKINTGQQVQHDGCDLRGKNITKYFFRKAHDALAVLGTGTSTSDA